MALDFGLLGAADKTLQTSDYRTAGSHQAENLKFILITGQGEGWFVIHTVTTGKTYYISALLMTTNKTGEQAIQMATGESASEVKFLSTTANENRPFIMTLSTPVKLSSGTIISVWGNTTASSNYTLIGWEE